MDMLNYKLLSYMRLIVTLTLLFVNNICQALPGDIAPRGNPDNQFDASDIAILQQMVIGIILPTPDEFKIADVAPLGEPDGVINIADILVLQNSILTQTPLPSTLVLCLPGNGCSQDGFLVGAMYFQESVDANSDVSIIFYDVNKNVLNVQYDTSGNIIGSDLVPTYSEPSDCDCE